MVNPIQKNRYEKQFSTIESSFRLEGMNPSGDAIYEYAKAAVLDGTMTPEQALVYVAEQSRNLEQMPKSA